LFHGLGTWAVPIYCKSSSYTGQHNREKSVCVCMPRAGFEAAMRMLKQANSNAP